MTEIRVAQMIAEMGIPFAYDHFADPEAVDPPFITYLYPESSHFAADNSPYAKFTALQIELYTDEKSIETEGRVERVLEEQDLFYYKSETWIEEEQLYEVIYEMEVDLMG